MQGFLEMVVKGLVDHPEAVTVTKADREDGTAIYEVRTDPSDMGKIIGKQGATIHAIRALFQVGSARKGIQAHLELIDEGQPRDNPRPPRRSYDQDAGRRRPRR